ncbi:MAG: hypothetical protein K1X94_29955, partial [Sandaracinaceae bacterium]|nr:hypothetical protein [Sandaracinaceae bacterium]
MTQPRTPQDWSIRLAVGLLAVSTVLAPLLFGGVLGWTVPVLASFAAASVLASAFAAWRNGRPLPQGLLLLTFVAATLWTVLQAVPVPCGLVEWIAPDSFEHVSRTAAVFGTDERCTITQDPGRTREEVLKGLTLVSLLVSASLVGALRRRDTLIQIVVIACSALAVVAVAHALADAPAIWGMYRPTNGSAALGPFVNPNHLGGLMALGAPAAFGLGTSSRQRTRRFQWMGAGVLLLGVLALAMARGAVLAGLAGLGLFGALTARHNVEHVRADGRTWLDKLLLRPMTLAALPVVGAAFVIAGVAGLDRVQRELGETDVGKLELAARALVMAATGPWVGVGRGAFGVAFVERTDAGRVRFEYAESFPAQWAVDWGIVVGPIIVIALGIVLIRAVRQADHPHLRGAVAGVCAYAIQNLVDFGLEELGSAAVAVVLLASVATNRASSTLDLASARRAVASAIVAGGLAVFGLALLGPSIAPLRVESSRAELERTLASN